MRSNLLILLLLLCTGVSVAQEEATSEKKKGKRGLFRKEKTMDAPKETPPDTTNVHRNLENQVMNGYVIHWRIQDSVKLSEGNYVDNRKTGTWKFYYRDGVTIRSVKTLENNVPKGPFVEYYQNGNLKKKGAYDKGHYVGAYESYYRSGCPEYIGNCNNEGKEDGTIRYYYDCTELDTSKVGHLQFEYTVVNGKPQGEGKRYKENGELLEVITYNAEGRIEKTEKVGE